MSITEACEMLGGITRNTLYRWTVAGKLPSVKLGRRRLYRESDLHDLMWFGLDTRGEPLNTGKKAKAEK